MIQNQKQERRSRTVVHVLDLGTIMTIIIAMGKEAMCVRQIYSASQKLKIAQYARHHGARAAGRHFGIHHKKCQWWLKDELDKMKNPRKHCCKLKKGQGRKLSYSHELEDQLAKWILEEWGVSNVAVSTEMIRLKGHSLTKPSAPTCKFKASNG